jgi:hypothetical protein
VLEQKNPGDDNLAYAQLLDSTPGQHTLTLNNLLPDRVYAFKARADRDGLIAEANDSAVTDPTPDPSLSYDMPTPQNISTVFDQAAYDAYGDLDWDLEFDGDYTPWGSFQDGEVTIESLSRRIDDPYGVIYTPFNGQPNYYDPDLTDGHIEFRLELAHPGTSVKVRIRAVEDTYPRSFVSEYAAPITVTAPGAVATPLSLSASAQPNNQVRLTWSGDDDSGTDFVWVYRVTDNQAQFLGHYPDTRAHVDVAAGTGSKFFVTYKNSGYSNFVESAGIGSVPASPTGLEIPSVWTESGMDARLSWNNTAANEDSYVIERSIDGTNWSTLTTVGADENSYVDSINDYTVYSYRVKSRNAAGDSQPTLLKTRKWPVNGIAHNDTNASVQVKFDHGWQALQPRSWTGELNDCDFIYLDGAMYKIGANRVFIRYADSTNTIRGIYTRWVDIDSNIHYDAINPMAPNDPGRPAPP